ncbi:MAG: TrkH family potassium uptake protein [Clostridia bacterium]|nr:TrkH family potassium uptake protein [Clostridia bacterium]
MNRRMVLYTVGLIVLLEAALFLLPLAVCLIYKEWNSALAFLGAIGFSAVFGGAFAYFSKPRSRRIYAKEGFAITTFAWLGLSVFGALPFVFSGEIPSFTDAFFETVSGFTTTGASILVNVEELSHGLLFWRSFTHWIGGMGVLVLLIAFLGSVSDRSIHILRAEMPGPTMGKLMPKLSDTAKILYLIYLGMTFVQVILLVMGGMPLFDSLIHTFGTAGTGGFGIYADGCAGLTSYQTWVITVFMILFGINFNLYYLILARRARAALRSTELWVYLGLFAVSTVILFINLFPYYESKALLAEDAAFQVASIITTTGYSTVDFNTWPALSKAVLFILMFIGGSAGSTAGGFKVSRVVMVFKNCAAEFRHMLHPRCITVPRMDGKPVDDDTRKGVTMYFNIYMLGVLIIFLLLSLNGFDLETTLTAAVTCFNNVGPGLGLVGPASNFSHFSNASTVLLSFAMLLGRLEIWPILLTVYPATWFSRKK